MTMREPRKISRIVVGAIAIAIFVAAYRIESHRLKFSRAKSDLSTLRASLENFRLDTGCYPMTQEGLGALSQNIDRGILRGVSSSETLRDPWGRPYFYESDGESYVLGSFGSRADAVYPDPELAIGSN